MEIADRFFEYALGVGVAIGVFLLMRPLLLWYWKIPERLKLLERIAAALEKAKSASRAA
jgi:hypothetical protein